MAQPVEAVHSLLDHEGPWTEYEFLMLPEDRRIELLDGGLLVSPYAGRRHQRASSRLWNALDAVAPPGCEVFATINVRVGSGRILIPDLVVVVDPGADDADDAVIDARHVVLVVEIVSPGSVAADRAIKPPLYAAAGIPHYLRVEFDGAGATAVAYGLRSGRYVETLRAGPGHTLTLVEPFPAAVDLSALARRTRAQA